MGDTSIILVGNLDQSLCVCEFVCVSSCVCSALSTSITSRGILVGNLDLVLAIKRKGPLA